MFELSSWKMGAKSKVLSLYFCSVYISTLSWFLCTSAYTFSVCWYDLNLHTSASWTSWKTVFCDAFALFPSCFECFYFCLFSSWFTNESSYENTNTVFTVKLLLDAVFVGAFFIFPLGMVMTVSSPVACCLVVLYIKVIIAGNTTLTLLQPWIVGKSKQNHFFFVLLNCDICPLDYFLCFPIAKN